MNKVYRLNSLFFWRLYVVHMRPYLLFVSGAAGAAGIAMGKAETWQPVRTIISFLIFFLGYGFGQALTDCFQTDTDKLSAPYRPLSKGIIVVPDVLAVSIAGLLLSGVLLFFMRPFSCLLSLLAVIGLATYSYVKKNLWVAGPFYNSWIVALLPLMGWFIFSGENRLRFPSELYSYIGVTFFSYTSFVLIGYLKDIEADKATGYKTFPVVWGWNKTTIAGDVIAIITLFLFWCKPVVHITEIIAGLAASIVLVYGQYKAHTTKEQNEKGAMVPIICTVRSFVLFHIAIILHFQPAWLITSVLYYIFFELTLYNRPSKYQV